MSMLSVALTAAMAGLVGEDSIPDHLTAILPRWQQPGVTAVGTLHLPDPRVPAPYPLNIVLAHGDQTIIVRIVNGGSWSDLKKLDGKKVVVTGELGTGPQIVSEPLSPRVRVIFATDIKAAAKGDKVGMKVSWGGK
jgi:hypothetical protein